MAQPRRSHARVLTPAGFFVLAAFVFALALTVTLVMLRPGHGAPAVQDAQARR
ncbi:MAG TPA: hypothetical protein VF459_16320 [Caulobacteraceae bacterium]